MMTRKLLFMFLLSTAACSDSTSTSPQQACGQVGISFCKKMYSCFSAADIAAFQLPPTEAECVTQENAMCSAAKPSPGYCKGSPQVSADTATACANEIDSLTCTQLSQPVSGGACKSDLCEPAQ
jgi:hypothetical protein